MFFDSPTLLHTHPTHDRRDAACIIHQNVARKDKLDMISTSRHFRNLVLSCHAELDEGSIRESALGTKADLNWSMSSMSCVC